MTQQVLVFVVLAAALAMFVWGRLRYDLVALSAVTILTVAGVLEPADVFHGFGNDAVLSVMAILVVGRAVRMAGATEPFAAGLMRLGNNPTGQTVALTGTATLFSAFMNNTGALTVFLPVAVHMSRAMHRLASSLLMPLAFATLLGGLITLIGTPPNILVSTFRAEHVGAPFGMFAYSPVGLGVAIVGIVFLSTLGWRLLPPRRGSVSHEAELRMKNYFAEVRVPAGSRLAGGALRDLRELEVDATVVGLVRGRQRLVAPMAHEPLEEGDLLLVEADGDELQKLVDKAGLELGEDRTIAMEEIGGDDVALQEIVVAPGSPLEGRTSKGLRMRWRYGMNVLAISRQGARIVRRLASVRFRPGDVLFVQVRRDGFEETLRELRCFTLLDHAHGRPDLRRLGLTLAVFVAAMTAVVTSTLSLGIAFLSAALALVLLRVVTARDAYTAVDWSVVVLLGATIPLGTALEKTGGADTISEGLFALCHGLHPAVALLLLMVTTMLLSNVINNAATAVLMAPIAYRLGLYTESSPDTFLMAVAIAASACFLTPIGHQCNILVLGPGGYHFNDYLRLGLPLSILVIAVALPLLLIFWPLSG